jgi:copper transport protein
LHGLDLLGAPGSALFGLAPWSAALASPFAGTATASLIAGLAAMAALHRSGTIGGTLAVVGWILAAISFSLFGHAATASPRWLTAPAIALHAGAFIFWLGALPGLAESALRARHDLASTLHRFSALAVPLVALLLLSGVTIAAVQLRQPSDLLDTPYGLLLTAKLAAVAFLLLLAALNRSRLTPAIDRGTPGARNRFSHSVLAEIVLGVMVLGLASGFRLTPPPRAVAAAAASQIHLHLHGPTVTAGVSLVKDKAGANGVEIQLQPEIDPLEVQVAFADPAQGVEPIRLEAVRDGGTWRAGPVFLPHGGNWLLTLDVLVSDFAKERLETNVALTQP